MSTPIKAINERIRELKAELKRLDRAKEILAEPEVTTVPANINEAVYNVIAETPGMLIKDIGNKVGVPYSAAYDAVHQLERSRKIVQSNKPAKQWKRYALRVQAEPAPKKEAKKPKVSKVTTASGRGKKDKGRSSDTTAQERAELQNKVVDWLKNRRGMVKKDLLDNFGISESRATTLIENLVEAEVLKKDGYLEKPGHGRNPILYKSLVYKNPLMPIENASSRETRIRPGEGISEGRRIS